MVRILELSSKIRLELSFKNFKVSKTSSDNFTVDDAAKDVDQDGLDARVGGDDAEGLVDALLLDSATQIEEVGRLATLQLDNVHGGHGQAGTVDETTNLTIKS